MANMHQGKPFTDTLGELQHGELLRELTAATYDMIAAVMDTRKPGTITLKLGFAPTGKGTVVIAAEYVAKEPEHDRQPTTFFVGQDFSLHRNDPAQPRLPLVEVERNREAPVKVEA
jgi:hypothetical protein